jgi:hypothetical protein
MSRPPAAFKRMVVGLPQSVANHGAVDAVAEFAELLRIELVAAYVADPTLAALAEWSGARELRVLDQEWRAINVEQITREVEHAASLARGRFAESVKSRTIKTSFDIVAGAEVAASLIQAGDIVAIIEPSHPGERITRQFTHVLDAAFATAAAVLVMPRKLARTSGPVLVFAAAGDVPSIRAGLEVAAALKERLIVVMPPDAPFPADILADADQLGIAVERYAGDGRTTLTALAAFTAPIRERLRVVTGGRLMDDASRLFSSLSGVPLLVVGGGRAEPADEQD